MSQRGIKQRKQAAAIIIFFVGLYTMFAYLAPMWSSANVFGPSHQELSFCEPRICLNNTPLRIRGNSSCSDASAQLATHQKVISFSYYEPSSTSPFMKRLHGRLLNKKNTPNSYRIGILENLKAMRQLYPGFVMRLYTDVPLQGEFCKMVCENPDLHWCDIRKTPSHGDLSSMSPMTWRFLALGDPTVDIFLSRDLDSILSEREQAAVADWLNGTNKAIHTMRDNQFHATHMLGGLWGASNSRLVESVGPTTLAETRSRIIRNSALRHFKGFDQILLAFELHAPYKDYVVAHDSYYCAVRLGTLVRPFPVRRKNAKNDFVGCPGLGKGEYQLAKCPEKCRPSYGKDWLYC